MTQVKLFTLSGLDFSLANEDNGSSFLRGLWMLNQKKKCSVCNARNSGGHIVAITYQAVIGIISSRIG